MSIGVEIRVNGEPKAVVPGTTLAVLLGQLGLEPRTLLVEYNGEPLARPRWEGTALGEGDRLELFRVSAGG